jgi:DNA polymerase (family X)
VPTIYLGGDVAVHNQEIAKILNRVADLLEIQGANEFRVRSYRNAARTLGDLSASAAEMVDQGEDISELPDIGSSMVEKVKEIVATGKLQQLEELKTEVSPDLPELMKIADLGPKRVGKLNQELGVRTPEDLKNAAEQGEIEQIEGFGKKTQEKIKEGAERAIEGGGEGRIKLSVAEELTAPLIDYLSGLEGVNRVAAAGSYRRRKETVGDIDILVTCADSAPVMDAFAEFEDVDEVLSKGKTRSSVRLRMGLQVDLRVVEDRSYGAALYYFTGSKAHNVATRGIAVDRGLKINEYGVFRGEKQIAGETEEDVLATIELPYVPPELRENRGEVEAAQSGELPTLVELSDIRGDFQSHSDWSDGKYAMEEMARAAKERGYEYFCITDHSKRVTMAGGLDEDDVRRQMDRVDKINDELDGFLLLKAIEVDILEDGSLDLPDRLLSQLDIVICSVHYHQDLSEEKQTERILRAMESPNFHILAHPTGRIIGERDPYPLDLDRILTAMKEKGAFIEINAQPDRLDISDVQAKHAKERGVKVAISTDAHSVNSLEFMKYGVYNARRGWLEADDVINTRTWTQLQKMLPS